MIYSNPEFVVLFGLTAAAYGLARAYRLRFLILLASSFVFYAWSGALYTLVFAAVILVSWLAVALGERFPWAKNKLIAAAIALITAHLLFWKYSPWLAAEIQRFYPGFLGGQRLSLPLPLGISFFTLQSIAYLVDYGNGQTEAVSLPLYALFKSFFAQLVAGPIVRGSQLFAQLRELKRPSASQVSAGLSLLVLGFFKKIVIADRVAFFVDMAFASPEKFGRAILIKALVAYGVQIWADFSGYTDMGRGAALILGIRLPENFLSPYLARSPSEFWQRWHITLSQWIKDYLFTPLALSLSRLSSHGIFLAALATMLVAGLWHGAGWNFALFGLYHGALLVLERKVRFPKNWPSWPHQWLGVRSALQAALMFCLVLFGWLIFRLESLSLLGRFLSAVALDRGAHEIAATGRSFYWGAAFCFLAQGLGYYDLRRERWPMLEKLRAAFENRRARLEGSAPALASAAGLCAGVLLAAVFVGTIFLRPSQTRAFIYFQF